MHLCIQYMITSSSLAWFPNSDIRGSRLICSSPRLFAACHVLRRLLMPRHSPYALFSLNFLFSSLAWVSQIISLQWKSFFALSFFALTLSESRLNCSFLPRFLERPFLFTLFLKSQNYLFVFFFIQFPMTFLSCHVSWHSAQPNGNLPPVGSSRSSRCFGGLKWSRVSLRFFAYTSYKLSDTSSSFLSPRSSRCFGGLKWSRTTDLMLIRHAL